VRKIKKIAKLLLVTLAITLFASVLASANVGSWGLSFPTEGETPKGNESADYLSKFDSYFVGNPDEKVIYLTFDGGYEAGYTEGMLDVMKRHNVPSAFFLTGNVIRDNPELINRMAAEGHIVANHTFSHPNMTNISDLAAFRAELEKSEEIYKTITGKEMPKFYRPPEGKYSESNLEMAQKLGYKTIFWSLAYVDWNDNAQPTKDAAFSKLIPRIHPGAVILLHNTSRTNSEILEELILKYQEMGYEFRSLEDLVR